MNSVRINRSALRELCVDHRVETILSGNLKHLILNTNLWDVLSECVSLLKPIISWLHIIESDDSKMSLSCTVFLNIRRHVQGMRNSNLLMNYYAKTNEILEDRCEFCIKPIHYLANLLDPSKRGEDLIDQELLEAFECLTRLSEFYSESEGISVEDVLTDCNMFRLKEGIWQKDSLNLTINKMSPYMWWKSCYVGKSLRKIALKVLSLPPTSAACERTNSTYKNVHNKTTNRLSTERAGKITYIKQNMLFLNPKNKPSRVLPNYQEEELVEIELSDSEMEAQFVEQIDELEEE
ncbi:uncharacterized protein LOC127280427 [Leptopilina boulardi]|uniref:uncharacterized protein LOC127280427 n=1 Tax=Leptopilina boulardi TaxID=63433 RepID=UPI0021F51175|nr:uncharacterized protein LOC127280427 [Leptopilina boulardi]